MKKKNIKIPKGFPKVGTLIQVTYYPLGLENKKREKPMRGTLLELRSDAIKIARDRYTARRGCWFPLPLIKIRKLHAPVRLDIVK
jgi:hypothetical protein